MGAAHGTTVVPRMPLAQAPPFRLGRYEVRALIAEGGMATVYVARRVDDSPVGAGGPTDKPGTAVAIKMVREEFARNREFSTMFLDEAKIVAHLRHPNIVRYHELGEDAGNVFIAMELLLGQSLWSVWDACRSRRVRLRYDMAAWIGARVAEGLHYAHTLRDEQGRALDIVHRDVNATNVFVTYDGEVKIIDFGLAKAANRASKTAAGIIKGKVAYMSPEQAVGAAVDARTDVFALGTTLWELTCDRRLFKHADEMETLKRVHEAHVPDATRVVAGYPPALWHVLRRALARDKNDRYPTAAELGRDLDAVARTEGRGVDAAAVAEVMRELFAQDRARQAAWIADASAVDVHRAPREPMKPTSSFWTREGEVRELAAQAAPPSRALAPAAEAPRRGPRAASVVLIVVVAALLVGIVGIMLAMR
jgi:serine/threonine protein kinase